MHERSRPGATAVCGGELCDVRHVLLLLLLSRLLLPSASLSSPLPLLSLLLPLSLEMLRPPSCACMPCARCWCVVMWTCGDVMC